MKFLFVILIIFISSLAQAEPELVCVVPAPMINESSGLAMSGRQADVFWTHNDSGDGPKLYAFNTSGTLLGTFQIPGAQARDWEDMAAFTRDGAAGIVCADTGDNFKQRSNCSLYVIEEPLLEEGEVKLLRRIDFTYEDGPRDCEAVAVDGKAGQILILTKSLEAAECDFYMLPLEPGEPGVQTLKRLASPRLRVVTAMDLSQDGLRLTIIAGLRVVEFTRAADEDWPAALGRAPRVVSTLPPKQWEAICHGSDGLCLTHEGEPLRLYRLNERLQKTED